MAIIILKHNLDLASTVKNKMGDIIKIKNNREFQNIYRKGRYAVSRALAVYVLPNRLQINRIGITASKKYGKSVKRNRIRRLIRESYQAIQDNLKVGYDFVIVARKTDENNIPDFHKIYRELKYLFKRLDLFDRK